MKQNKLIHIEEVENKIKETIGKSKVTMSTSEIKRTIPEASRTILRIMTRDGLLKQSAHYLQRLSRKPTFFKRGMNAYTCLKSI